METKAAYETEKRMAFDAVVGLLFDARRDAEREFREWEFDAEMEPVWAANAADEDRVEAAMDAAINKAIELVKERHGSFARDYLIGYIQQALPKGPPPPGTKTPIPKALRQEVLTRDGFRCRVCGRTDHLCCDHIIPESEGGPTTKENLQTLCRTCNVVKRTRIMPFQPALRKVKSESR